MHFRLTPAQEKLTSEVSDFVKANMPDSWQSRQFIFQSEDEWREARKFDRKLGAQGWLAPGWPKEYGGQDMDHVDQLVLTETLASLGAPDGGASGHGPHFVGPGIFRYGTEWQKKRFLPPITTGEEIWAQLFSEPDAGSDMAAGVSSAIRDGDEYVVNGEKIWTGQGHRADFGILLARTDPDAPKHRGLSLFILDMSSPGVTIEPMFTLPPFGRLNRERFDNVRIPAQNLLGEENRGWPLAMEIMDFERSNIKVPAHARRLLRQCAADLRAGIPHLPRGNARYESVRLKLAELAIKIEVAIVLNFRSAWIYKSGHVPNAEASETKVMGAAIWQELAQLMWAVYGLSAQDGWQSEYYLEAVQASIVSGSSEVMRNVIATRGLGLPR